MELRRLCFATVQANNPGARPVTLRTKAPAANGEPRRRFTSHTKKSIAVLAILNIEEAALLTIPNTLEFANVYDV